MQPFTVLTSVAATLLRNNVDTDLIIPIGRIVGQPRESLSRWCCETLRFNEDGSPNPDFFLNDPDYAGAEILLGGVNFGCGSSREGAVVAFAYNGIRCIIAPSFGPIFYNNCFQNGVLPILLDEDIVTALAERVHADPRKNRLTVNLERQVIHFADTPGETIPFPVDAYRRQALLRGLDEIGGTLEHADAIAAFQARDREERPWVYVT